MPLHLRPVHRPTDRRNPQESPGAAAAIDCSTVASDPPAVAHSLYDAVDAGRDASATLASLMGCLGIAIIPGTDRAAVGSVLAGTTPGVIDVVLMGAAVGLHSGLLFALEPPPGVAAPGASPSASSAAPSPDASAVGGASQAAIDLQLGALRASGGSRGQAAALVIALGQERASRDGVIVPDALLGDATLDPLQLLLLGDLLPSMRLGGDAGTTMTRGVGRVGAILASVVRSGAGTTPSRSRTTSDQLGIDSLSALAVCGDLVGTRITATLEPGSGEVWHRNGRDPDSDTLTGHVGFDGGLSDTDSAVAVTAGCPPPPAGAMPGLSVDWSLDEAGKTHGDYGTKETTTDGSGDVLAAYHTVSETAPRDAWIMPNQHEAAVHPSFQVLDAFTAFPGLTLLARAITKNPETSPIGRTSFLVAWYITPTYTLDISRATLDTTLDAGPLHGAAHLKLSTKRPIELTVTKAGLDGAGAILASGPVTLYACHGEYRDASTTISVSGHVDPDTGKATLRLRVHDLAVGVGVTCPGAGGSGANPAGGFGNDWASTLGPITLPAAGGHADVDGARTIGILPMKALGSFDLTLVPGQE